MSQLFHQLANKPFPSIGTSTGVAGGGLLVTIESTLPIVQMAGAIMALMSGLIGIAIGLYHLKEIAKKELAAFKLKKGR